MADLRIPDLNRVTLACRTSRDPEARVLPGGQTMCKMGLAYSRKYRTAAGEQKEETLFINATCWGKTAEYVSDNIKKGRPVLVEGRLKMDEWEDKTTGQKRTAIEIVADRVHTLDWEERAGSSKPQRATASVSNQEYSKDATPEEEFPF